jgi:hypothetical protein
MSSIALQGNSSGTGTVTVASPNTNSNYTVTLPTATGTLALTSQTPTFKNRIINGAMMIDQRNSGAEVNPAIDNAYYLDRWRTNVSVASKFKIGQNAGGITPPVGYTSYLGCTSLSAYAVQAGEIFNVQQRIEGLNAYDLAWGTANAATVTLSFWVYSSLTGTFGGALVNSAQTRSYPFSYVVSTANTWTQISVTIPGDTTGTWLTTTGNGVSVIFSIGTGATFSGTAGAWAAANYASATGAVSVVGTNGATFYITGVQLEKSTVASTFDFRLYGVELALCQRYYIQFGISRGAGGGGNTTTVSLNIPVPVTMRATPTVTGTTTNATRYDATGATNVASATYSVSGNYSNNVAINIANLVGVTDNATYWVNGSYQFSAEL